MAKRDHAREVRVEARAHLVLSAITAGATGGVAPRYFNRNPGDPWDDAVKRCSLLLVGDRWKTVSPSGIRRTARGTHVFVVQGGLLVVQRVRTLAWRGDPIGHLDLARGEPVEFGGEILFGNTRARRGRLDWWNDRTGHYHDPDRPMDPGVVPHLPSTRFRPYYPGV